MAELQASHLPDELLCVLAQAHGRLGERLRQLVPALADELLPWMQRLAPADSRPETYFTHPCAFPLMLLPWYLDEALDNHVDRALQADLLYSSICGYYLIRLIDDVMDRSPSAAIELLPAVCVLHAEFQASYAARFAPGHPFWPLFFSAWAQSHEASVLDSRLVAIDATTFAQISARKVSAVIIPMTAVSAFHGIDQLPPAWTRLTTDLGAWHQLHNDLFDWTRDLAAGTSTWFLSEGERRRASDEALFAWVAREGFDLAISWLEQGLIALQCLAADLRSPSLLCYFDMRRSLLQQAAADGRAGLPALILLFAAGLAGPRQARQAEWMMS